MHAQTVIDRGPMGPLQWAAVLVTVCLNALDGFDVLSISFAAPGIAKDWNVSQAALGWVLSMEVLGMAVGSLVLGGISDRIGRRPTILLCLFAMAIGMYCAGNAGGLTELLGWRLLTGLGIGGMLAAINAAAAEFSNGRWRSVAMALMVIGYPLGGVFGGLIVQDLLGSGTWRDVFHFGALATAMFIPIVWLLVPETPGFLDRKRQAGALDKINRTLRRFGHEAVQALSPPPQEGARSPIAEIFKPGLIATTLLLTVAYFAQMTTFYFLVKWVPKIVVDMGFDPRSAAGVLTWANAGGAVGGAIFGLIAMRVKLRTLTIVMAIGSAAAMIWFGSSADALDELKIKVLITGFMAISGITGLYTLIATAFPTDVRGTGTGFAIGVGRGGAILAPILAGYLFQAGLGLQTVAICMSMGSGLAAVALIMLKQRPAVV